MATTAAAGGDIDDGGDGTLWFTDWFSMGVVVELLPSHRTFLAGVGGAIVSKNSILESLSLS